MTLRPHGGPAQLLLVDREAVIHADYALRLMIGSETLFSRKGVPVLRHLSSGDRSFPADAFHHLQDQGLIEPAEVDRDTTRWRVTQAVWTYLTPAGRVAAQ